MERQRVSDLLEEYRQAEAREHLIPFACYIDPRAAHWYQARHLAILAEHLEALERREIKRLIVSMPPRHWKSSTTSIKFPAWYLGKRNMESVILASYSMGLPQTFSRSIRDVIQFNDEYKKVFPGTRIRQDTKSVNVWALTSANRESIRIAGVGSGIIGHGGNLFVIDDVMNQELASSKTQRDKVWDWWKETLRPRAEPDAVFAVVMSRWHKDDFAGRLTSDEYLDAFVAETAEKWTVVNLPAVDSKFSIALWSDRYPIPELRKIRKDIGSKSWAAQFMGNPIPEEGRILDSSKLVMIDYDKLPIRNPPPDYRGAYFVQIVRRWDLAFSDRKGTDWVAGALVGIDNHGNRFILDIKRFKGRWNESYRKIIQCAHDDGTEVICYIESNQSQIGYFDEIKADRRMSGIIVRPDPARGSKEMRAETWGSRLDDGIIYCVRAPWNGDFFDEIDSFPAGEHDDQVDAVSGAMVMLGEGGGTIADSSNQEEVKSRWEVKPPREDEETIRWNL